MVNSKSFHARAVIRHGMRADGHASTAEVGDQAFFSIHGAQRGFGVGFGKTVKQRAGMADRALDLPESVSAMEFPVRSLVVRPFASLRAG